MSFCYFIFRDHHSTRGHLTLHLRCCESVFTAQADTERVTSSLSFTVSSKHWCTVHGSVCVSSDMANIWCIVLVLEGPVLEVSNGLRLCWGGVRLQLGVSWHWRGLIWQQSWVKGQPLQPTCIDHYIVSYMLFPKGVRIWSQLLDFNLATMYQKH